MPQSIGKINWQFGQGVLLCPFSHVFFNENFNLEVHKSVMLRYHCHSTVLSFFLYFILIQFFTAILKTSYRFDFHLIFQCNLCSILYLLFLTQSTQVIQQLRFIATFVEIFQFKILKLLNTIFFIRLNERDNFHLLFNPSFVKICKFNISKLLYTILFL